MHVRISSTHLCWAAAAGALFSLLLMALRISGSVSFAEPLHVSASGAEYESLYAIWKQIHGLDVYADRFSPPYDATIYNWAFYEIFGVIIKAVLGLLSLGEAWLPTVGRMINLAGVFSGMAAAYLCFARSSRAAEGVWKTLALAFAVFLMVGPLVGFWVVSVRPDVWAMTFEIAGAALFLAYYPRKRIAAVLFMAVAAYLAWSFKQINVTAVAAAGGFLLYRRDWKMLGLLSGIMIAGWSATLAVGDPNYLNSMLFGDYPLAFSLQKGARNIVNFAVKSGPSLAAVLGLAAAFAASRHSRRELLANDAVVFALAGILIASALMVPASFQLGGAEHYYFTLSFFLSLLAVTGTSCVVRNGGALAATLLVLGTAGWLSLVAAISLVLSGQVGVIDIRQHHTRYVGAKSCLDELPRPLFVYDRYLSLPWMTPGDEHFVLSYVYERERALGRPFQESGVGGYVSRGHFKSLALPGETVPDRFDGASLDGYTLAPERCREFWVFIRDPSTPPGTDR